MSGQLEMNLEGGNHFSEALRSGRFSIVLECAGGTTDGESSTDAARGRVEALARKAGDLPEIAGISVMDRLPVEDIDDPTPLAALYSKHSGKPVVLHLSGKGSDPERIRTLLTRSKSLGIQNILAVTGDRSVHHPNAGVLRQFPAYENGYLDSARILKTTKNAASDAFAGAVVNPHKYQPSDLYVQYFKAVRKLACGAEYLVAQAGWDIRKLQELQWFLQMRELDVPVLARLLLLNGGAVRELPDSLPPGVAISRSLAALFQREFSVNETQSLAAQIQRIALLAAGCRLLGYNGVQIGGIHDPQTLEMVVRQIRAALEKHTDYCRWLNAWTEHHAGIDFSPVPRPFYYFRAAEDPIAMYDPAECSVSESEFPRPRLRERLRSRTLSLLLNDLLAKAIRNRVSRILCRSCRSYADILNECEYLCISQCPKRLVYGPCGSGRPDGTCEFGKGPCFFHRVLSLANARGHLDRLETEIEHD
ncbi:MAG: methylenetetrahydrofolate reductase C-terminal domain-containing protein [Verrucomicrobiota bacterium]